MCKTSILLYTIACLLIVTIKSNVDESDYVPNENRHSSEDEESRTILNDTNQIFEATQTSAEMNSVNETPSQPSRTVPTHKSDESAQFSLESSTPVNEIMLQPTQVAPTHEPKESGQFS
ncbi:unnamed protein product, partial [Rotaria magnacalcarata]